MTKGDTVVENGSLEEGAVTLSAAEFWEGRCGDCAHDEHPLRSCHEITGAIGGDPSNGPDYCPCAVEIGAMEQFIGQLRAAAKPLVKDHAYWLTPTATTALRALLQDAAALSPGADR